MVVSEIHFVRHISMHLFGLLVGLIVICVSTNYADAKDPTAGPFIPFDSESATMFFESQATNKSTPLINDWKGLPSPTSANTTKAQEALIKLQQSRLKCQNGNTATNMTKADNCNQGNRSLPLNFSQRQTSHVVIAACTVNTDQSQVANLRSSLLYEILRPGLRAFASLPINAKAEPQQIWAKFINTLDASTQSQLDTNFLKEKLPDLLDELKSSKFPILKKDKLIFGPASPYAAAEMNEALNGDNIDGPKDIIQSGYVFNDYQKNSIPKKIKLDMDQKIRLLSQAYDKSLKTSEQNKILNENFPALLANLIDKDYNKLDTDLSKKNLAKNCSLISNPQVYSHLLQLNSTRFSLDLPMDLNKASENNIQNICIAAREALELPSPVINNTSKTVDYTKEQEKTSSPQSESAAQRQANAIAWLNLLIREHGTNSNSNIKCAYEVLQKFALEQQEDFLDGHLARFCKLLVSKENDLKKQPLREIVNNLNDSEMKCYEEFRAIADCNWRGSENEPNLAGQIDLITKSIRKKTQLVENLKRASEDQVLIQKLQKLNDKMKSENGKQEGLYRFLGDFKLLTGKFYEDSLKGLGKADPSEIEKIAIKYGNLPREKFSCTKSNGQKND